MDDRGVTVPGDFVIVLFRSRAAEVSSRRQRGLRSPRQRRGIPDTILRAGGGCGEWGHYTKTLKCEEGSYFARSIGHYYFQDFGTAIGGLPSPVLITLEYVSQLKESLSEKAN